MMWRVCPECGEEEFQFQFEAGEKRDMGFLFAFVCMF